MQKSSNEIEAIEKYQSILQFLFLLADPQHMFGEVARGTGKSSIMLPSRMDRVMNAMPGSTSLFANASFVSLYEDILPTLLKYFTENYERGIYWEMGKKPPSHFVKPREVATNWKNVFSLACGSVMYFTSMDKAAPNIGKNTVHIFNDEMLRIDKQKATERLFPTLRQDRTIYGDSCYYAGITGFSSSPNLEFDHSWWLDYEKDMDEEAIKKIIVIAHKSYTNNYYISQYRKEAQEKGLSKTKQTKYKSLVRQNVKNEMILNELRKGVTYFGKGSAFSNILILGIEYIQRQFLLTKDFSTFATSILNIRQKEVKNKFFSKFSAKNLYEDSYVYNRIDTLLNEFSYDNLPSHNSSDLKHLDGNLPLRLMYDPGAFSSLIVGQKQPGIMRIIKNFWVIPPEQHRELAEKFNKFFESHPTKEFIFDSDRAGNKKKYKNKFTGEVDDTDVTLLLAELKKLGWNLIEYRSEKNPTLTHKQQYYLLEILFGEHTESIDKILIDQNECEELKSSINFSPLKKTDGEIELDKTAEKNLSYEDQILYSPQLATALIYGLAGEYLDLIETSYSFIDMSTMSF